MFNRSIQKLHQAELKRGTAICKKQREKKVSINTENYDMKDL